MEFEGNSSDEGHASQEESAEESAAAAAGAAGAAAAGAAGIKEEITGVVPLGNIKKIRTKEGEEKEKLQLKLRACISCRLVMTEQQFYEEGCPNCAWLQIDGDRSRVLGCTSPNFAGFIAVVKPQGSWVARHNKLTEGVPGCYAVKVLGDLPDSIKDDAHRFAFAE